MPRRDLQLDVRAATGLEAVVDDLARRSAGEPLPPHEREVLVVQSRGLARWLTLELATRLGCAAHADLPFPQHLISQLLTAHGLAEDDAEPWSRDELVWRLDDCLAQGDLPTAPAHYLADGDARKRHQLADRLADRFDAYQVHRPELVAAWRDGKVGMDHAHAAWQMELWRRLAAAITVPDAAERLETLVERLRNGDDRGLPSRLGVIITGVMPRIHLRVIEAIAGLRRVTVWLLGPTQQDWSSIASPREIQARQRRRGADGFDDAGHPLLAVLARQGRDWFRWLTTTSTWTDRWQDLPVREPDAATLLGRIQQDIADLAEPDVVALGEEDRSLALHCCHGERREIEVLRDRILDAFATCPGLRPADVLVLMADGARYAPLIDAVFGAGPQPLPYRIADRSVAEADEAAQALLALLTLVEGRLGHEEVLAVLRLTAVRSAAAFSDADLERIAAWSRQAGVRWGADGDHRQALVPGVAMDAGSWRTGLNRLLAGYALGPLDTRCAGLMPVAGMVAVDAELLGRFVAWLDRLLAAVAEGRHARAPGAWAAFLSDLVDGFLLDAEGATDLVAVRSALAELAAVARRTAVRAPVPAAVIADHLTTVFAAEQKSADFVSGSITVAAFKPMRSIPARVVALVGMGADAFPRRSVAQPFDLIAAQPQPGDRDTVGDDRQMFLEALLAARERLIITWPGLSQVDDAERPPSSCVAILLDVCAKMLGGDAAARARLVTHHRRQPFAAAHAAGSGEQGTFDTAMVAVATTLAGARTALPPFVSTPPPMPDAAPSGDDLDTDLENLVRFWRNPARAWCQAALDLRPADAEENTGDDEAFARSPLVDVTLGDAVLRLPAARRAARLDRAVDDGQLPPGALGDAHRQMMDSALAAFAARLPPTAAQRSIALEGPGWRLSAQVPAHADEQVLWRYAHLKDHDRLRAACAHLAWNAWRAAQGLVPGTTHVITRDEPLVLAPCADAPQRLARLMDGMRLGQQAPLPFFCATSRIGARMREKPLEEILHQSALRTAWQGNDYSDIPGEGDDAAVALAWRGREALDATWLAWACAVWDALNGKEGESA